MPSPMPVHQHPPSPAATHLPCLRMAFGIFTRCPGRKVVGWALDDDDVEEGEGRRVLEADCKGYVVEDIVSQWTLNGVV